MGVGESEKQENGRAGGNNSSADGNAVGEVELAFRALLFAKARLGTLEVDTIGRGGVRESHSPDREAGAHGRNTEPNSDPGERPPEILPRIPLWPGGGGRKVCFLPEGLGSCTALLLRSGGFLIERNRDRDGHGQLRVVLRDPESRAQRARALRRLDLKRVFARIETEHLMSEFRVQQASIDGDTWWRVTVREAEKSPRCLSVNGICPLTR